jgi:hypothetical protein
MSNKQNQCRNEKTSKLVSTMKVKFWDKDLKFRTLVNVEKNIIVKSFVKFYPLNK